MPNVFAAEEWLQLTVLFALVVLKGVALVNACLWSTPAYEAANKLTKPAWVSILALALVVQLPILTLPLMSLLNLAGTVAAIVYLVDVRPSVSAVSRRRS